MGKDRVWRLQQYRADRTVSVHFQYADNLSEKKDSTFKVCIAYYQGDKADVIGTTTEEFICTFSNNKVLETTAGDWYDEYGREYIIRTKQAGTCNLMFINSKDGNAKGIEFRVIDSKTGLYILWGPKDNCRARKNDQFL